MVAFTSALVECVPNISEGRDRRVIDEIVNAVREVEDISVLGIDPDADHNRTVITFVGSREAVKRATLRLVERAVARIDLNRHRGEHPRMGAVDVIPFVPIQGVMIADCVVSAEEVGKEISQRYRIPVYLYDEAARDPRRRNLAEIRRGEFEEFAAKIERPEWVPDFGEPKIHPTAGVTAVGAHSIPLIAFNVNLGTQDVQIAKRIARAVRGSNGGLKDVKALGFNLKEKGMVQVSMNLTNHRNTPLFRVFELIKREAARYGVPIIESEIVGLVPQEALNQVARDYLQLDHLEDEMILERGIESARP